MEKGHEIWYLQCKESFRVAAIKSIVGEFEKYKLDLNTPSYIL